MLKRPPYFRTCSFDFFDRALIAEASFSPTVSCAGGAPVAAAAIMALPRNARLLIFPFM
jgi:hypothetical protein